MSRLFTPEARAAIVSRVEQGVSFADAARAAGIKPETARTWAKRGRREDAGDYADFAAQLDKARELAAARPTPMTVEEFRREVETAVRAGSVAAMRLWADRFMTAEPDDDRKPASVIHLLAARRDGSPS